MNWRSRQSLVHLDVMILKKVWRWRMVTVMCEGINFYNVIWSTAQNILATLSTI